MSSSVNRLQPALRDCRDMALNSLTTLLSEMFDKSEQALLDFIDKADTNQGQFQFIDAISVVNSNRKLVEQRFREEIARGFAEYLSEKPISYAMPLLEVQIQAQENLELVDDQELDKRLSLQNMISRTQSQCFQDLYALMQRLSMVRGGVKLADQDIPAGPVHTASAFQVAAVDFGFESNVLLIMYALFEKFVMRELGDFYKQFNEKLIAAGVFPNLKLEVPKHPKSPDKPPFMEEEEVADEAETKHGNVTPQMRTAGGKQQASPPRQGDASSPQSGDQEVALGEEIFNSIRNLMADRRRQDPKYSSHPQFNPDAAPRAMVDTPVLISAIDKIQPIHSASFLPEIGSKGEKPTTADVDAKILDQVRERLIEERERLFQGVDRNSIPSADLDTIELVGMLFEHVLNEEDLPNIAKALISHLHTPYLKVAILDHHFLIDSRHIARQLLNLMVESGLQWIDENDLRRGIYYPMQEGVNRILAEFKKDVDIFIEVFEALTKQIEELSQKAKIVETRAQEAAKGRERLESARLRAHRFVQEMIGERRLHPILEHFLNHAWLDKMILMLLRDPMIETNTEWRQVLGVIDDIIWMYESREKPELKNKQLTKLSGLKKRIESGLASVGDFHQPDLKALFDYLESLAAEQQEIESITVEPVRESPPRMAKKRPHPLSGPVGSKPDSEPLSTEVQQIINTLKSVKFGTWFELEDDNRKLHQLKLSWFSPVTQKYMFVNKSGIQALVTPIERLATQMHAGRAKILKYPSVPFVDRALESVLGMLQKTFGNRANN
ncbi:MAG: DUF1631 domain-containing protein [Gammaproteobacteria bacterium]|nr:DUF1631 domain-containing protein [Gammaproteobacteria bacterium]